MLKRNFVKLCLLALALPLAASLPAQAATVIKVSLWDKGGMMDMSKNMGLGMGMHGKMEMAIMGIKINKKSVPHGKVTFDVVNDSKETVHEMLVAPVKDENTVLPFVENENRVNEEKSGDLGEVSELEPGKSGSLTLDLKPGNYLLFCNVPGHYTAGMWTMLKVK
ncbi:MAG: plastocyanin/azurin family copper-binding protein [Aestuariivirga sp.]